MAASQITPIDYEGFKTALRLMMKGDPRFKDFDFEGSGLVSILRLLSTVSSSQAVSSHLTLAESHVSTSEILENARALVTATSGFYVPSGNRAASATVQLTITPPDPDNAPTSISVPLSFTALGVSDGKSFSFSPVNETIVDLVDGKYTTQLQMREGTLVTSSFVKLGSAPETFEIPNKDIDISTIQVFVRNSNSDTAQSEFLRFESAFQLGKENKLFYLSMNRRGFYQIEFGDDSVSKALVDGNIVYVRGVNNSGSLGNGVSSLVATSEIEGFSDIEISMLAPSVGGSDPETLESIKLRSSIAYGMDGVAVSTQEYGEKLADFLPNRKITQWGGEENIPPKPGFVILCVYPVLTDLEKTNSIQYLKKYNVGSIFVDIVPPIEYLVGLKIYAGCTSTVSSVKVKLRQDIEIVVGRYSESMNNFSIEFEPSSLEDLVKSSVENLDRIYVTYNMGVSPSVSKSSLSFDFHRQIASGTFVATFTGHPTISQIKDDGNGIFNSYYDGELVEQVSADFNFDNGSVTLLGLDLSVGSVSFGYADVGGSDLQLQTKRNEILKISVFNLEVK